MRQEIKVLLVLGLILVFSSDAWAIFGKKKKEEAKPVTPETVTPSTPVITSPVSLAERKEKEEQAKKKLSMKEWVIYLTPMAGKVAKAKTDILNFNEGKFNSQNLSQKGYPSSNITLTIQDNGVIVWETMQTAESGDVAFWRGELEGEVMRGVVSIHPLNAENEDYSFSTNPPPLTSEEKQEPTSSLQEAPKKKR
ncbi:MAG: hypothetical protein N2Z79_04480 [Candidatus Omnitrophica bacterium]|nr:hypothetical protein [Candidatus Omnitrophota bacterium]